MMARLNLDSWRLARNRTIAASAILIITVMSATRAGSTDCCDPKSPFREGEGWADTPATCENIATWAAKAPVTDARISMAIQGKLSAVHWTGVLAYLEMCDPKGLRVVCVTYQTNGLRAGDVVKFAGGYQRSSDAWVMLDPCLASQ